MRVTKDYINGSKMYEEYALLRIDELNQLKDGKFIYFYANCEDIIIVLNEVRKMPSSFFKTRSAVSLYVTQFC